MWGFQNKNTKNTSMNSFDVVVEYSLLLYTSVLDENVQHALYN